MPLTLRFKPQVAGKEKDLTPLVEMVCIHVMSLGVVPWRLPIGPPFPATLTEALYAADDVDRVDIDIWTSASLLLLHRKEI